MDNDNASDLQDVTQGLGIDMSKVDTKSTIKRLGSYILKRKLKFILILISAVMSSSFTLAAPYVMGRAITSLFTAIMYALDTGGDMGEVTVVLGFFTSILLALYVLSAIFKYKEQYIMASLAQEVTLDMRNDVSEKLNRLPLKYFDKNKKGDILSKATNDIEAVATALQEGLTQFLASIISAVGAVIMMLYISPILTLVSVISLPIIMMIAGLIGKKAKKYFSENQENLANLNSHIEEAYTGQVVVKAFSQEEKSIRAFKEANEKLYKSTLKSQFLTGISSPLVRFVNNIGYVIIAVGGGIFVTQGRLAIGSVQSFIIYSSLFGEPLAESAYLFGMMQSGVASSERVFKFLDEEDQEEDIAEPKTISNLKGKVEFRHVKFGYSDDKILMQDINMDLKSGQKVAIVGPTGAGKTTLVNLLMRFYEIQGGNILIDDVDTKEMSRKDLRSKFGMVLQDTWLFSGTIFDNIAYGKPDATKEEVVAAAKSARVDHFIRTLPEGYNTILNEESSNISQGQKQLLTIARVMLKNPSILILDEATSNIDTRTEIEIQRAMLKLMENKTSFVIAHRLSTIRDADLILVMKEGTIIEMGNHEKLIEEKGFYESLYNSQFENTDLED